METSNDKEKRNLDNGLTKEQKKELELLAEEMSEDAKLMVDDYKENPSTSSGSVDIDKGLVKGDGISVHINSEFLKDNVIIEQEDDGEI
tara:strand:- start:2386 stop:2652 length:267 start_codon:yes stop_codon:yes gene_type:complete